MAQQDDDTVEAAPAEAAPSAPTALAPSAKTVFQQAVEAGAIKPTDVTPGEQYNGVEVPSGAAHTDGNSWFDKSGAPLTDTLMKPNGSVNRASSGFIQAWNDKNAADGIDPLISQEVMDPFIKNAKAVQDFANTQADQILQRTTASLNIQKGTTDLADNLAATVGEANANGGPHAAQLAMNNLPGLVGNDQVMGQLFPGWKQGDDQNNLQIMLARSVKAGVAQQQAQATVKGSEISNQLAVPKFELEQQRTRLAQAELPIGAVQAASKLGEVGFSAANTEKSSLQADSADELVHLLSPYRDAAGLIALNQIPATAFSAHAGMGELLPGAGITATSSPTDIAGAMARFGYNVQNGKVNYNDIIHIANSRVAQVDAALQASAGTGASDFRTKLAEGGAGELSLEDNNATIAAKLAARRQVLQSAREQATARRENSNAGIEAIIRSSNAASRTTLNPKFFQVFPNGVGVPTPLPTGQTGGGTESWPAPSAPAAAPAYLQGMAGTD